jgi:hypothetical protein
MKRAVAFMSAALTLFYISSCASGTAQWGTGVFERPAFTPHTSNRPRPTPRSITDYRGKSNGKTIPRWLTTYIDAGNAGVEKLRENAGWYCFVDETASPSLNALLMCYARFDAEREAPHVVFMRLYQRLVRGLVVSPDVAYGSAFEALLRNAISVHWNGVEIADWCWTKAQRQTGETAYNLYVLMRIQATDFQQQFKARASAIRFEKTDTASQRSAFLAVIDGFFQGW